MNKMAGTILMVIGALCLLTGMFIRSYSTKIQKQTVTGQALNNSINQSATQTVLTQNEKDTILKIAIEQSFKNDQRLNDLEAKLKQNEVKDGKASIDQTKKDGDDFEKYIVKKFNKKYFKIKEWTGDKYVDGIYAESTLNPDILLEYNLSDESKKIAVECKWRKNWYKDGIEFSYPEQLERYKKYEKGKDIPVFIALGVNGSASKPEHLYIIPLKNIKETFLTRNYLKDFEIDRDKTFHFDMEKNILE